LVGRLALRFGYTNPEDLLDVMTSRDLTYWQAFDSVRPIDPTERMVEQLATLCCLVANAHGANSRLEDWLPWGIDDRDDDIDPASLVAAMPGGSDAADIVNDELAELEAWKQSQKSNNKG
jgi:hypothetical protein